MHGDYKSLVALLELVDLDGDLLVFLGDYADRGPSGVEVIRTVAELRKEHPKNVVALMGNHEDFTESGEPNFNPCTLINEAQAKTGSWQTYFRNEVQTLHRHPATLRPDPQQCAPGSRRSLKQTHKNRRPQSTHRGTHGGFACGLTPSTESARTRTIAGVQALNSALTFRRLYARRWGWEELSGAISLSWQPRSPI